MNLYAYLIVLFLKFLSAEGGVPKEDGHCIVYGSCVGKWGPAPCVHAGPPKPLDKNVPIPNNITTLEFFTHLCPEFVYDDDPHVCCSIPQMFDFEEVLEMVKAFGFARCPSCLQNIRRLMCYLTCSPWQSRFLRILRERTYEAFGDIPEQLIAEEMKYFVSEKFLHEMYESCEGLQGLLPGKYALDIFCGSWGRSKCSPTRWAEYLGSTPDEGGYSPFKTLYKSSIEKVVVEDNRTFYPINPVAHKCSESPGTGLDKCSCSDCEESCSADVLRAPDIPPPPEAFKVIGYSGSVVIMTVVFVTVLIISTFVFSFHKNCTLSSMALNEFGIHSGYSAEVELLKSNGAHAEKKRKIKVASSFDQKISNHVGHDFEKLLEQSFQLWAIFVFRHPKSVIFFSLSCCLFVSSGLVLNFNVTTDPVDLWASATSEARHHMEHFNAHFGPFYRIVQIIITPTNQEFFQHAVVFEHEFKEFSWGPAFQQDFLFAALDLQLEVQNLVATLDDSNVTLKDICVSPLSPMNTECAIQSPFSFIQNGRHLLSNKTAYLTRFKSCSLNPSDPKCFAPYGGPVDSTEVVLGGFNDSYDSARALVITIPLTNYNNESMNGKAEAWEKLYINFMKNFSHPLMRVAFMAHISIQDEIERGSESDVFIVAISYTLMLCYITISLGEFHKCRTFLVESKFTLGFFGVLIVLVSVVTSLGIFSFLGVPATLIIVEVIPFLVLAVGVDNIFILVQAYQRESVGDAKTLEERMSSVVGRVAPSLLLSSVSMSSCFFIGTLTEMPAVRHFALYAGVALVVNFFLQMTCFLGLFILDLKRQEDSRLDACCCVKVTNSSSITPPESKGLLYKAFKDCYAPFLMKDFVRYCVAVIFVAWTCCSVAVFEKIHIGFDQKLTVPEDSYMQSYFEYLEKYLSVGFPVFFVISDGYNYTSRTGRNKVCSTHVHCDSDSITYQLGKMAILKNRTFIAFQPISWMDSYLEYLQADACCFEFRDNGTHCPSHLAHQAKGVCVSCQAKDPSKLSESEFTRRLQFFLNDSPWNLCPKGGKAMFSSSVELLPSENGTRIGATNFMTYHTALRSSEDFYEALRWSRIISKNISESLRNASGNSNVRVFPYSFVHIFFEQYLTMWTDTLRSLALSVAAVYVATFILLGFDLRSATIVTVVVVTIVLNTMGLMYWWSISLNAIALVNLVVAVGISVEFCSHLTRSFALSEEPNRVERVKDAMCQMGTSILSGITLTDCGILVLAFAKSPVFKVVYFRMYFGIIAFGTLHGLVFLPVLLSILGPPVRLRGFKTSRNIYEITERESSI